MPKLKTNSGAAKRFKVKGPRKKRRIVCRGAERNHGSTKNSGKVVRQRRQKGLKECDVKLIDNMLAGQ